MRSVIWPLAAAAALGCGEAEEAPRVQRDLVVHAAALTPVTTASGWRVRVDAARAVLAEVRLTRGGETHAQLNPLRWLVGVAHAHPGHGAGGQVVASLPGRHVVDLAADGAPIGAVTALTGPVDGVDFTLVDAEVSDGLSADDPALGCAVYLAGEAQKAERVVPFTACLTFPDGAQIQGAPLGHTIRDAATGPALGLGLALQDPYEPDTLFDGVDFDGAAGPLTLASDADADTNRLRRAARTHDHWIGAVRAEGDDR